MQDFSNLPDPDAESLIFSTLTTYAEDERTRYAAVGLMADTVEKRMLWKCHIDPSDGFPCRSFARWAHLCPYPYSTIYAALRDVQALADVPAADLAQIPHGNFGTLKQLSTKVRNDPKVLALAKTRHTGELVDHIKAHHPTQHIESSAKMFLNLTEGAKSEIEEAVELAIERGDAETKESAVLMWAIGYKQDCHERNEKELAEYEGRVQ